MTSGIDYQDDETLHIPIAFIMDKRVFVTDEGGNVTILDATWIQRYLASIEIPYEIGILITINIR